MKMENETNPTNSNIVRLQDYLKYLRESHGYSQEQVADELHISRQTYSHYECGRIVPPVNTLFRLATFFEIPAETLIRLAEADYKRDTGEESAEALPDPDAWMDDVRADMEVRPKDINAYNIFIETNQKRFDKLNREEKCCLFYFDSLRHSQQTEAITYMKIAKNKNDTEQQE
ncbi:MAG: helix-turn-helix domain-containing protein [Lachnospiraceae bacterium]|nr:helix-turn-helix domain-containing protein [Lachnospiraceae bacterium]